MDELTSLIAKSKFVLFTYSDTSVLSSGALMDTLGLNANIIGPNAGAFADLARENIIQVYDNFIDLIRKIETPVQKSEEDLDALGQFIKNNDWQHFGINIDHLIKTI